MRRPTRSVQWLALVALAGCQKAPDRVPVYPVSGQVIYADKPAAGVQVFLLPTNAPTPPDIPMNPHAVTGPDGKFTVSTYADGDGAPEGSYEVILLWPEQTAEEVESPPDRLFGWYDAKHSKLNVKVKAGENALPAFKLPAVHGPPPASEGIPGRN